MTLSTSIRSLFQRPAKKTLPTKRSRLQWIVEDLESRLVPASTLYWLGSTDGNFSGDNWTDTSGGAMVAGLEPQNGDTLNFDTTQASFVNAAGSFTIVNDLSLSIASLSILDNSATGDFNISGNAIGISGSGITSDVQTGVAATLGFGASGISLGGAAQLLSTTGALTLDANVDNGGALLTVGGAGSTIINGALTGLGGLTKIDAGFLTLSSSGNSYSGVSTLSGGTITANSSFALGNPASDITFAGGTLQYTSASAGTDWSARFKNSTSAIRLDTNGQSVALASAIAASNNAGLVKIGAGTLTLSAANLFTGGLTVKAGTALGLNATSFGPAAQSITLGDTSGSAPATLLVGTNSLTIANPIVLATGTTGTLTIGNTGLGVNTTFSGGVTGTNSFTINAGNGATNAGSVTFSTAAINNSGAVTNGGASYSRIAISSPINANVTKITQASNTAPLTLSGGITVNSGGTTLEVTGLQNLRVESGAIGGTGNLVLQNNGGSYSEAITLVSGINMIGSLTDSGTGLGRAKITGIIGTNVNSINRNSATSSASINATNTLTGPTNLNGGVLNVRGTSPLGTAGTINFGGGILQYGNGFTADLSARFNATGGQSIIVDTGVSVANFATGIQGVGTTLTKLGSSTMTLSSANTYTGTTTIGGNFANPATTSRGGTLRMLSTLNGTTGTALTFAGTGVLSLEQPSGTSQGMGVLTFNGGDGALQSLYPGSGTTAVTFASLAARASGAVGALVVNGGGIGTTNTITLTGATANSFIDRGLFFSTGLALPYSFAWNDAGGFVRAINYTVDPGAAISGVAVSVPSQTHQQIAGNISAQDDATFSTLNINGNNNLTLASGKTVTVDSLLKSGNIAGGAVISGGAGIRPSLNSELIIRTDLVNDVLTITSPILANGANALTKSGAGLLRITGNYNLTGALAINDGILVLDTPTNQTISGPISGAGRLVKIGNGTLTLNGTTSNTLSGPIVINGGTLALDFSNMGANPTNLVNPFTSANANGDTAGYGIVFGISATGASFGAPNGSFGTTGGGTLLIKGKSGANITTQSLPGTILIDQVGTLINPGSSKILVDPNNGTETRVILGKFNNLSASNLNSNGGTLLLGKAAGAGAGEAVFMFDTGVNNGPTFGANMGGRILYTSDGGTSVDFVTAIQQASSPYNLVPVGTNGTSYVEQTASNAGGGNQGPYYRLLTSSITGSTLTMTSGGNQTGLKIVADVPGKSMNLNGNAFPNDFGLLFVGPNDFTISNSSGTGAWAPPNSGPGRSIVVQQYGTGVLTLNIVIGSGNTSNGGENFTKSGPGKVVLGGQNTYPSNTFLSEGIVNVAAAQTTGSGSSGPLGRLTTTSIFFTGGTLQYSSANTFDYSPHFATGAGQRINIDTNGQDVSFASALTSVAGTLSKLGAGTLTLTGTSTYTGTTTVSGGRLTAGPVASINGTSDIAIGAAEFKYNSSIPLTRPLVFTGTGGTITGTGTINTPVAIAVGNTLAPGNSGLGTIAIGSSLTLSGIADFEVAGGASPSDEAINITELTYGGTLKITNVAGPFVSGDSWDLFDFTSQSGAFDNVFGTAGDGVNLPSLSGGLAWQFDYATGVLSISSSIVAPTVVSVSPVIGPTTGGTLISILGTNFVSITSVTVDGTPLATFNVIGTTEITATTPMHVAGAVDIVVTNPGGSDSLAGSNDFTYAKPQVTSVVVNGGPNVTLSGTGSVVSLAGQNSVVKQILVTFNQPVTVASDAFKVTPHVNVFVNGGADPSTAAATTSVTMITPTSYLVTFVEDGGVSVHAGGVINSGVYDLTTLASKISANGDTMASNRTDSFFALFGTIDANNLYLGTTFTMPPPAGYGSGDGFTNAFVDPGSLFQFSDAFGSTSATPSGPPAYNVVFDSNLDGFVDPGDLFAFSDSFGIDWEF